MRVGVCLKDERVVKQFLFIKIKLGFSERLSLTNSPLDENPNILNTYPPGYSHA